MDCETVNDDRKPETVDKLNDLFAIKRTQFGTASKLKFKFLAQYKITSVMNHGSYGVGKVGDHEGLNNTLVVL